MKECQGDMPLHKCIAASMCMCQTSTLKELETVRGLGGRGRQERQSKVISHTVSPVQPPSVPLPEAEEPLRLQQPELTVTNCHRFLHLLFTEQNSRLLHR